MFFCFLSIVLAAIIDENGVYGYTYDNRDFFILALPNLIGWGLGADDTYRAEKSTSPGDLNIPESIELNGKTMDVIEICTVAFKESKLTRVKFPLTIKTIADNAFESCEIEVIDLSETAVTEIPKNCFLNANKLKTLLLPHSMASCTDTSFTGTSIEVLGLDNALNFINLTEFSTLTQVIFYDYVSTIPELYFYNLPQLKKLIFNQNPTIFLDSYRKLEEVVMKPLSLKPVAKITPNFQQLIKNDKLIPKTRKIKSRKYIFEDSPDGKLNLTELQVKSIGKFAFQNDTSITYIEANTLTSIGVGSFTKCSNLQKVDLSNSKLTKIGALSFADCTNLEYIMLPSELTDVSYTSFSNSFPTIVKLSGNSVLFQGNTTGMKYIGPSNTLFGNLVATSGKDEGISLDVENSQLPNTPAGSRYIPLPTVAVATPKRELNVTYLVVCIVLAVLLICVIILNIVFARIHVKLKKRNALILCSDEEQLNK